MFLFSHGIEFVERTKLLFFLQTVDHIKKKQDLKSIKNNILLINSLLKSKFFYQIFILQELVSLGLSGFLFRTHSADTA